MKLKKIITTILALTALNISLLFADVVVDCYLYEGNDYCLIWCTDGWAAELPCNADIFN